MSFINLTDNNIGSTIKIPSFLQNRIISNEDLSYLIEFFKKFNIKNFAQINFDMINEYAQKDYDSAIKVNTLLGLYGVDYIGRSANKYSPNSRHKNCLIKVRLKNQNLYNIKLFNDKFHNLELKILDYLNAIGLSNTNQINGINLCILLDKLGDYETNINELLENCNKGHIDLCIEDNIRNFYAEKVEDINLEIQPLEEISKNNFSNETPIMNLNLTTRTTNVLLASGIDDLQKLLEFDLDKLRTRKNVGIKTIQEIEEFIDVNQYEKVEKVFNSNFDVTNAPNNNENNVAQKIPIDERVYNLKFENLCLSEKVIKVLEKLNLSTIGELLSININALKVSNSDIIAIYKALEEYGIERFQTYTPVKIETPQIYFSKLVDLFNNSTILNMFSKHNLKNIGQLAGVFPDIFVSDDEFIKQESFFEKIDIIEQKLKEFGINDYPVKLSYFEKIELNKKSIDELANIDYISLISNIILDNINLKLENLSNYTSNKNKFLLREKEIDVLNRRFGINYKKQTLEEVGQDYVCTRERIRQIGQKAFRKLIALTKTDLLKVNEDLKRLSDELGTFICINQLEELMCPIEIINEVLKTTDSINFDIDFENNIIKSKNYHAEFIFNDAINNIKKLGTEKVEYVDIERIFISTLNNYVKNGNEFQKNNFQILFDKFFSNFIENNLIKLEDSLYKLSSDKGSEQKQARNERIIYLVDKLYPDGIHLPIDNDEQLFRNLKPLYDEYPEIMDLGIRSMTDRLIKQDKDIIWWDRGHYIHINNVKNIIDWQLIDFAINEIIAKFDSGITRIKPYAIFSMCKDKFIAGNIPNEIALLGLIKYKNNPRFDYQRQEIRDKNNFNSDLNLLQSFEDYVYSFKDWVPKKQVVEDFCQKRGWKAFQIEFLYGRSENIYRDGELYIHKDNLKIDRQKLNELIGLVTTELDKNPDSFLHLRKIKNTYPSTWVSVLNNNISPNLMGRILMAQNIETFTVDNYVYVKMLSENTKTTSINMNNIMDSYVKEQSNQNKFVTISEMQNYCTEQGLKDSKQAIIECIKKFSFEYSEDCYVHYDAIGFSDEFLEDMSALIQLISEEETNTPLMDIEDILIKYNEVLPSLNEEYIWTVFLLKSILQKFEILDVFYKSFIFKNSKFQVEDLDDTAAYLMLKNFDDGYCKIKELDKLLAKYKTTEYKKLHFYRSKLFFEGSSIRLVDNDTAVIVEKFARDKYSNV